MAFVQIAKIDREERLDQLPGQFAGTMPEETLRRLVRHHDRPAGIDHQHGAWRGLHRDLKPFLRLLEAGDVASDRVQQTRLGLGVRRPQQIFVAAVGTDVAVFERHGGFAGGKPIDLA